MLEWPSAPLAFNVLALYSGAMRRTASVFLGLFLVFGSAFPAPVHVHAASSGKDPGGHHADHVHLDPHDLAHHAESSPGPELSSDHSGDDAVVLTWSSSEARTKRALAFLATSWVMDDPSEASRTERRDRSGTPPRDPPLDRRPPGRAPPA